MSSVGLTLADMTVSTALSAAATAGTAAVFTSINPVGAAILGGTNCLSGKIIDMIADKTGCCPDNLCAKLAKRVTTLAASTAIGIGVAHAAGYAIPAGSAIALTLGTTAVVVVGSICVAGVVALAIAAIVAIAIRNGQLDQDAMRVPQSVPGSASINQSLAEIREVFQQRQSQLQEAAAG